MKIISFKRKGRKLKLKHHNSLAVEIVNLKDITKVAVYEVAQIKKILLEHPVIVIRGNRAWSEKEQVSFAKKFGDLDTPVVYSTLNPSDKKIQKKWPNAQLSGLQWHSDRSYAFQPPYLSFFQMIESPTEGNETLFINLLEAHNALSSKTIEDWRTYKVCYGSDQVEHPLIWLHPFNGRKSIYFDFRFASKIIDYSLSNGNLKVVDLNNVISELENLFSKANYYNHKWDEGDILIVDNYAAAHRANIGENDVSSRVLFRVATKGIYF